MNRKRLEELHNLLLNPPAYVDLFWMEAWTATYATDDDCFRTWPVSLGAHDCGTSACALGLACLHPPFQAQGLHLDYAGSPWFDAECGYAAARAFFGLGPGQATFLFSADAYAGPEISPQMVATRVREILDQAADALAALEANS